MMLVYLLSWATTIPLWVCFGLVGACLAILSASLVYAGKKKFDSFNPLPAESAQALKENVQCLVNAKS
jgi:ligand-binding sensor domain-containing protein